MKVQLTTASQLAAASMEMSWKENLQLFITVAIAPAIFVLGITIVSFLALVLLFVVLVCIAITTSTVMFYADYITYPGVWIVSLAAAILLVYAREQKPRRFFDWLAQGGVWFFGIITAILAIWMIAYLFKYYTITSVISLMSLFLLNGLLGWRNNRNLRRQLQKESAAKNEV
ncbi:MAG TPA: hypothetical protein PKD95_02235 [Candidatus Paceibacterota bacterium]|nr:hypothetical protein [Candidatus Paceibacterota bacterium]